MTDVTLTGPRNTDRPEFRWRSRLEGAWYNFRFAFMQRDRAYYMDIGPDEAPSLVTGIRVVTGVSLLRPIPFIGLPPGQLFVVDDSGLWREPTLGSFKIDHRLVYRDAATVLEFAGSSREVF